MHSTPRAEAAATAAGMLAGDPVVRKALAADDEDALSILNQRAVVVRDRMGLDLVQIYNGAGEARVNSGAVQPLSPVIVAGLGQDGRTGCTRKWTGISCC